jgi:hypothetical protein
MPEKIRTLYITKNWVILIFIYYTFLFTCSLFLTCYTLLWDGMRELGILKQSIIGSAGISLAAAAAAYVRKLYKLCFNISSDHENADQLFLKRLGTVVYFLVRPLFSILFAILVVVATRSGIILSTSNPVELDEGFLYLTMASSFYVGFLSGNFIKKLESEGQKKLDPIVN